MSNKESNILRKLKDQVTLKSIHLKKTRSDIALPPSLIDPEKISLKIDYIFNTMLEGNQLYSFAGVVVSGVKTETEKEAIEQSEKKELFSISCVYVANYSLNNNKISEDEAKIFTENNALFNLHPFIREQISTTSSKMGLIPITLPLVTFKDHSKKDKQAPRSQSIQ